MENQKIPKFLQNIKRPWMILAPMVTNSEEAFRTLVRRYGADLCYTEMVHSRIFNQSRAKPESNYWYTTSAKDRPLVIQICGNDPEEMLKTALKIQDHCDAIDINFGCPQEIARKGKYGSFLMEDWELITNIVRTLSSNINVPLFCKIRVFESIDKTVEYAKIFERNGCALLAVHGRKREQRGANAGYVSYKHIKAVKDALTIPVISNGGVLTNDDIPIAIKETGCDGVMIAEPILFIPTIFTDVHKTNLEIFEEYITIIDEKKGSADNKNIRSHTFKMLKPLLDEYPELRDGVNDLYELSDYFEFIERIKGMNVDKKVLELRPNLRKCYFEHKE